MHSKFKEIQRLFNESHSGQGSKANLALAF